MTEKKTYKIAWWTERMGGFANLYRRSWYQHQGYGWYVKLCDRHVQGESVEDLIVSLKNKIQKEQDDLKDENKYTTSDRYGHVYPDNEQKRWARGRIRDLEWGLEKLEGGNFGPTHTVNCTDGTYDDETAELFNSH